MALVEIALVIEMVVNRDMDCGEFLQGLSVSKSRHRPFPPSKREIRVLGPVVQPAPALLTSWISEHLHGRSIRRQRIGEDDLIYTANVYGPLQFDEGRDTPIAAVLSWMQYKEMADAAGTELVRNEFPHDSSLLAWAPIGSEGAPL